MGVAIKIKKVLFDSQGGVRAQDSEFLWGV